MPILERALDHACRSRWDDTIDYSDVTVSQPYGEPADVADDESGEDEPSVVQAGCVISMANAMLSPEEVEAAAMIEAATAMVARTKVTIEMAAAASVKTAAATVKASETKPAVATVKAAEVTKPADSDRPMLGGIIRKLVIETSDDEVMKRNTIDTQ